jgi:hypothetical protein
MWKAGNCERETINVVLARIQLKVLKLRDERAV